MDGVYCPRDYSVWRERKITLHYREFKDGKVPFIEGFWPLLTGMRNLALLVKMSLLIDIRYLMNYAYCLHKDC